MNCKYCGIDLNPNCKNNVCELCEIELNKNGGKKMTEEQWSIAVEGASIAELPEQDRWAKIIEPAPAYMKDEQAPNAETQRIKLIVHVELSDGRKAQYYMNRTSARKVASILKTDLSEEGLKKWLGYKVIWGKVLDQMVAGQQKKVLYITDVKSTEDAVIEQKIA